MSKERVEFSPAEFKQIPLDFIIAAPLKAVIEAQGVAALSKLEFIKEVADIDDQEFSTEETQTNADPDNPEGPPIQEKVSRKISVPTLALVTVPGINIDSFSVDFEYSIDQVYEEKRTTEWNADAKVGGILKAFNLGFSGSFSSNKSSNYTTNKSGTLNIKLNASEAPQPEGLTKVLNWLTESIKEEETRTPV